MQEAGRPLTIRPQREGGGPSENGALGGALAHSGHRGHPGQRRNGSQEDALTHWILCAALTPPKCKAVFSHGRGDNMGTAHLCEPGSREASATAAARHGLSVSQMILATGGGRLLLHPRASLQLYLGSFTREDSQESRRAASGPPSPASGAQAWTQSGRAPGGRATWEEG